jgi:hypothetical protein
MEEESWHYLEVEVTPEAIRARWREPDGSLHLIGPHNELLKTVEEIRVERLHKTTARHNQKLDELRVTDVPRRIDYSPRGAVGLYVKSGAAEFRNVIFERLANGSAP